MIETIKKTWAILTPPEQKRALILVLLMIGVSLFDLIGIGSVVPFLTVLMNPESIQNSRYLKLVYDFFGFSSERYFLVFLGAVSFAILIVSSVVRSLQVYAQYRFAFMRQHSVASRILERYLDQPYTFFLNRNPSELSKNILSETSRLVSYCIAPLLGVASLGCVVLVMLVSLFYFYPLLTLIMIFVFGGVYFLLYKVTKKKVQNYGEISSISSEKMHRTVAEIFGGVKEFKILGKEKMCYDAFYEPSFQFAHNAGASNVIGFVPKYFVEAAGFGSIIILSIVILASGKTANQIVPILGVFAFASYKLLPSLQGIYQNMNALNYSQSVLKTIYDELFTTESSITRPKAHPIHFNETIEFKTVEFHYSENQQILHSISFRIEKGQSVGIKGKTGSGKSTLIDILIGLLFPTKGAVLIDGKELNASTVRSWQSRIGYVPQAIFLADTTVAKNIAFGVPDAEIDYERIQQVSEVSCINDFVRDLPNGLQTWVGDRGIRLSGGQRQRLGIARALYHNPEVLVLDEATSALDSETEAKIMNNIQSFSKNKTIFMIAHRLSTLEKCDRIIEISKGQIV